MHVQSCQLGQLRERDIIYLSLRIEKICSPRGEDDAYQDKWEVGSSRELLIYQGQSKNISNQIYNQKTDFEHLC